MKILLTAIGCPGGAPTIRALKRHGATVVGTDVNADVAARRFVDRFYEVPKGGDPAYVYAVAEIVDRERPDALLPQSSDEIWALSICRYALDTVVMVGESSGVFICLNKKSTYHALKSSDVPLPEYVVCHRHSDIPTRLGRLPVIKPLSGKGGRGIRIVVPEIDRVTADWRQWPNPILVTRAEVMANLHSIPLPVMLTERLPGAVEHAVDVYCRDGEVLGGYVRSRLQCVHGLHSHHRAVEDGALWEHATEIVERLRLSYFVNIQFKDGKLLEVNPRKSTFLYSDGYDLLWLGIRHALGQIGDDEVRAARLAPGTECRYYWEATCWT